MGGSRAIVRSAAALLASLATSCDLPIGDWPTYGTLCSTLASNVRERCADRTDRGESAIVDCQVRQLKRAGFDAINHDNSVYCIEPFRPFTSTASGGFYDRCPYALVGHEGACYRDFKYGHVASVKECVLAGMPQSWRFVFGKDYHLKPGTQDEFLCTEEMVAGGADASTR
jgi:hypothetical protein